MKTFIMVILLLAVGLLGADEYLQRTNAANAQKNLTDAQTKADNEMAQINALTLQVNQLKAQINALNSEKEVLKTNAAAATQAQAVAFASAGQSASQAAAMPTPTPPSLAEYSNALAIIEGKNSVGSGFICNMDGHTYVITNAHVIADNPGLKVTSIKGTVFNIGQSAVAVGRDVVRMEVTGADKAFDIMPNTDSTAKIGDPITVLGNPEGAGVVTSINGTIVGLGPDLVEVNAAFVKGNSGSPIIHQATGNVIGVATYIVERKLDAGAGNSVQNEVRRFGYRIDSIKQWQPINWQVFYAQSAQLAAMETLSNDFVKMFGDTGNGLNFDPNSYSSPALQRSIRNFLQAIQDGGRNMSVADRKALVERFIADLRSVSHSDILAFNKANAYDYFAREVDDQARFRDEIYQGLTQALENIQ